MAFSVRLEGLQKRFGRGARSVEAVRDLSPRVEYYSIDEFFFDATPPRGLDPQRYAVKIRDAILERRVLGRRGWRNAQHCECARYAGFARAVCLRLAHRSG